MTAASGANARILAPFVPLLVTLALWLYQYWSAWAAGASARAGVRTVALLGGLGLVGFAVWSVGLAYDHGRDGQAYASSVWARSELIRAVSMLPEGDAVYSNNPLPISYAAGRDQAGVFLPSDEPNPFVLRVTGLEIRPRSRDLLWAGLCRMVW